MKMAETRRRISMVAVSTGVAVAEAGQGGAVGAEEEGGLDQVALGLEDGAGGEFAIVAGALGS